RPEGYWQRTHKIRRKYDILLHIHGHGCALCRTGYRRCYQQDGAEPDFDTMAKCLASCYAPIYWTSVAERSIEMLEDTPVTTMSYFRDISTFGGCTAGPVAALENMRIIEDENLLENTIAMGDRLMDNLGALMDKHAVIGDVRGKGLFCGAELVQDRATKEPM